MCAYENVFLGVKTKEESESHSRRFLPNVDSRMTERHCLQFGTVQKGFVYWGLVYSRVTKIVSLNGGGCWRERLEILICALMRTGWGKTRRKHFFFFFFGYYFRLCFEQNNVVICSHFRPRKKKKLVNFTLYERMQRAAICTAIPLRPAFPFLAFISLSLLMLFLQVLFLSYHKFMKFAVWNMFLQEI